VKRTFVNIHDVTWLDVMFGVTVKNAFRLYDGGTDKWYLLVSNSAAQRRRWMQAFDDLHCAGMR